MKYYQAKLKNRALLRRSSPKRETTMKIRGTMRTTSICRIIKLLAIRITALLVIRITTLLVIHFRVINVLNKRN